jgi:CHAP domain
MTAALARIQEIQAQLAPPAPAAPRSTSASADPFASALATAQAPAPGTQQASSLPLTGYATPSSPYGSAPLGAPGAVGQVTIGAGTPMGQNIAQLAAAELGVAEAPPGSNDGPRIAQYRQATAGAGVGPWCSYFTSWVAASAGAPVGNQGQGFGWVPDVSQWGKDTGRWVAGSGGTPAVGDLAIFDRNGDGLHDHIGVVTNVLPDGSFETVEGNSSDRVSARSYSAGGAAGFVRPG